MNTENHFLPMFSSLTYGYEHSHHECNDDNLTTMSSSTAFEKNSFKNKNYSSMLNINERINQDEDEFHYSTHQTIPTNMNESSSSSSATYYNHSYYPYANPFEHHHHHHRQTQIMIPNKQQHSHLQHQQMRSSSTTTTASSSTTSSKHFGEDEHCKICGDLASGWHCGAITCEACKKFFLRSISTGDAKKKYKCQKDLACSITKRSRTQCQFCRFEKCLAVGMKPHESVGPKTEDLYKKLPCLVCGAAASGIHFGAVTCEACKGFFRRSIKENAPERYRCAENNNCQILATSKITCRACRFAKCIQAGMSMDASCIGRQSNLFKESIRQLQNGSTSMASTTDSARITSMAKRRKTKVKTEKMFPMANDIETKLLPNIKEFVDKIHNAFVMDLRDLPRCIARETAWRTMASQMIVYAEALMNFCQKTIPDFVNLPEKYEVISSSINSVIMICLFYKQNTTKPLYAPSQSFWNYWNAELNLSMDLNSHIPQITEIENTFRSFESKLQNFFLDETEISLLILMIITRTNLNIMNEENKSWSRCQFECSQSFSEYTQARRMNTNGETSFDFHDIVFLVSQLRALNRRLIKCFSNLPWPYVANLPSFFYRIYIPLCDNSTTILAPNLYNC